MPVIATSFAKNVSEAFSVLYTVQTKVKSGAEALVAVLDRDTQSETDGTVSTSGPPAVVDSLERLIQLVGRLTKSIESGNYQGYCLYIMTALIVLLLLNLAIG
jgi:hypothetical protein